MIPFPGTALFDHPSEAGQSVEGYQAGPDQAALLDLPGIARWSLGRAEGETALRPARILLVDDEPSNVQVLSRALYRAGFSSLKSTLDPRQVLQLYQEFEPDLILLDLHMPGLDGLTLLEQLRSLIPADTYLPILMLTGDARSEPRQAALSQGVTDFLVKPFDPPEVVLRIRNMLETRALHLVLQQQKSQLEIKVQARTRALEQSQLEVLERLATAAEFRDDDTGRHTQRVASVAAVVAKELGLPEGEVDLIRAAATLHDVGKIGIPDQILLKPGRLSEAEFEVIKGHTVIGSRILGGGRSPLMQIAERIARSHHERWDGTGYPDRLSADTIPLEARILSVADVFDALTHTRPYRPAWAIERVRDEVATLRGRHFDPQIVDVFLAHECSRQVAD